jgi:hypothetical protein
MQATRSWIFIDLPNIDAWHMGIEIAGLYSTPISNSNVFPLHRRQKKRQLADGETEVGVEPSHTTAKKPGPL